MLYSAEPSSTGNVTSLRSACDSICCTRKRRRSTAVDCVQVVPERLATGWRSISLAISLDSRLSSQLLPTLNVRRQWPQISPVCPRLENARWGDSGSSSTLPQLRQTCNSGSQPESRTAHSEKYVAPRHTPPGAGSDSSTATRRRKNFSLGSAEGNSCSLTSAK